MTLSSATRTPGISHFTPTQLLRTAHLFARDPDLADLVGLDPTERRRHELASTRDLQMWLISWPVGATTGWHDHGPSNGAFVVVRGALTERTRAGGVGEEEFLPSQGSAFASPHVHEVINLGGGPAFSVHAYSPALADQTSYDLVDGHLVARD
ncbi:cysteine dioxygenase [Janibacter sp. G56]|uniref:cysteine dioxygenase n=1 Tax=Janibacter sp. G56 TaxID=3418717 RepID=UPI003D0643F0